MCVYVRANTHTHTHTHTHIYIYIYIYTYKIHSIINNLIYLSNFKESPFGLLAKVLDYILEVTKFELQSCYYIHARTKTNGKGMNPLSSELIGQIVSLLFLYKDWFSI